MEVRGVIDRIEDGRYAVILVEELQHEFVVEKEKLPAGAKEGDWLWLELEEDKVQSIKE
ncbi:DUF3006 domain-containing protein [Salsuginibacillus kocurii]|uniref:DUF3006 domain-containing protein n=1 Tax=Salsuginibacillus kocurii TaxID=427078 RepID=UPI0003634B9F|nr:DUF3006 domain-containing protein [Salsuginibacillus kocurii]